LPFTPVGQQNGNLMPIFGKEAFRVRDNTATATSEINEIDFEASTVTLNCAGHAARHPIGYDEDFADAFARGQVAMDLLMDNLLLEREWLGIQYLLASASWSGNVYSTSMALDQAATEVGVVLDARREAIADKCGRRPNKWAIGPGMWNSLKFHAKLVNKLPSSSMQFFTKPQQLAEVLDLDEIIVMDVRYDSANEGQTSTLAKAWGDEYGVLFYAPPVGTADEYGRNIVGSRTPTLGKTAIWDKVSDGTGGFRVRRWDDPARGTGGTEWIQAAAFYGFQLTMPDCGELQTNLAGNS
jgi:hypothetical protein